MSLVKFFCLTSSILLLPLTALICELMFTFSSASFMAQDLIFKMAPFSWNTRTLFLAAIIFLKVSSFTEQYFNYNFSTSYSPVIIFTTLYRLHKKWSFFTLPTPHLSHCFFFLPPYFWSSWGKYRSFNSGTYVF